MRRFIVAVSILCFSVAGVIAQGTPTSASEQRRHQDDFERRKTNMNLSEIARRQAIADQRRKEWLALPTQPKMTDEFRASMEAPADLVKKNSDTLKAPSTGIVKLLSSSNCRVLNSKGKIKDCLQRNANVRSFANAFSFREKKRAEVRKADLILKDGYFVTGRHSVQTILIALDKVDLADVSLETPGVGYLVSYRPPKAEKRMDSDYDMFKGGITLASFKTGKEVRYSYGKISKVEKGKTYVMRSIAYRTSGTEALPKDQDVIFAFKVVEKNKDKDATIIWKELKRGVGMEMVLDQVK